MGVAIEMFSDFNTRIERMMILETAKQDMQSLKNHRKEMGDLQESGIWRFPEMAKLVGKLLQPSPRLRPNAKKLLEELQKINNQQQRQQQQPDSLIRFQS